MITIINERNGHKTTFKSYHKLYSYINNRQHVQFQKLIDEWVFARHSYRRVMAFYNFISRQKIRTEQTLGKKWRKFDVLEISQERSRNPIMLAITPDLDIESSLENWCRMYCKSRGLKLVEVYEDDGILRVKKEPCDVPDLEANFEGEEGQHLEEKE